MKIRRYTASNQIRRMIEQRVESLLNARLVEIGRYGGGFELLLAIQLYDSSNGLVALSINRDASGEAVHVEHMPGFNNSYQGAEDYFCRPEKVNEIVDKLVALELLDQMAKL